MWEIVVTGVLMVLAFLYGKRQQKTQQQVKEREQADAFNDAIEGSHAGGAAWADRLRETDPVRRDQPPGGRPADRADGKPRHVERSRGDRG